MDIYSSVTQKQLEKKKQPKKDGKGKNDHKTKKIVHDLFVQGTNDSSIVSKRSVEILYSDKVEEDAKHFFQYFVKKSPRRSPVINRGYWIRMKSIRMAIEKIISQQPKGQRVNVVNLGCGYDPLPFQLLDDDKLNYVDLHCIDVDFPELIGYKSQMIRMAPELMELIGEELPNIADVPGIEMRTKHYSMMGCDLTNRDLYCKQLDSFMANDSSTTNIFIAEVSLAYMTPETANPIIKTSSEFSNSHFLILEQLMPSGEHHPFSKRMINHFKKMEAPLQCVHTYPTIDDQIKRFQSLGYEYVNARNLLDCWDLVDNEIKEKVEKVEAFDEWEEFIFFGHHYINLHATNQKNVQIYPSQYCQLYSKLNKLINHDYTFEVQHLENDSIQRKFHSCLNFDDALFLTSGTNHSRLSDTISLNSNSKLEIIKPETFKPRVAADTVTLNNSVYLIGGRRMPGLGINEFWELKQNSASEYEWIQKVPLLKGRVKHTSIKFDKGILVYGGSEGEGFAYYFIDDNKWIDLISDDNILGFESSKLIATTNGLFLVGGKIPNNGFEFNSKLYKVTVDLASLSVKLSEILEHHCLARYGFNAIVNNDKILIVGGVGKKLYEQHDTVIEIDTTSNSVNGIKIDDLTWSKSPVFIGSGLSIDPSNLQFWLVCGGAVCYGFGSVWNDVVNIKIGSEVSAKKLII